MKNIWLTRLKLRITAEWWYCSLWSTRLSNVVTRILFAWM